MSCLQHHATAALANAAIAAGHKLVIEAEGVLLRAGGGVLPGAAAWLALGGSHLAVVSNGAASTAEEFAASLAGLGLAVPADRVLTAGAAAVAAAATRWPGGRVLLLAPPRLLALAASLGLEPASGANAQAVVVAHDTSLTWARLAEAAAALARGVALLAANQDAKAPDGAPGPGAILAALAAAVPGATAELLGLPAPGLLRHAACRAGEGPAVLVAPACRAACAQAAGLLHLVPEDMPVTSMAAYAAPGLLRQ